MFSQDSKFVTIANKAADLIILSCLWLFTCIPLVTVGAACAAAYDAVIKVIRQDSGHVFSEYMAALRQNFKDIWAQTLGLWAMMAGFSWAIVRLWPIRDAFFGGIYFFMSCFFALTLVIYAVHLFCLCGRFPLPRGSLLKVALWMTFSKPLHNLLLAFVILGLLWIALTVWQLVFILPGLFFLFLTYLEEPGFHRFINYEDDLKAPKAEE